MDILSFLSWTYVHKGVAFLEIYVIIFQIGTVQNRQNWKNDFEEVIA